MRAEDTGASGPARGAARAGRQGPVDEPPRGGRQGRVSEAGLRLFPSGWSRRERIVYGGAILCFTLVFLGLIWPVYTLFAGIRPLVLGLPFSLAYVVVLLLVSFMTILALYLWETHSQRRDPDRGAPGTDD